MLVASTSVLASTALLLPLALRERRHRGFARRLVAVRRRKGEPSHALNRLGTVGTTWPHALAKCLQCGGL